MPTPDIKSGQKLKLTKMKTLISSFLLASIIAFVLFGCKKTDLNGSHINSKEDLNKDAKNWLSNQPDFSNTHKFLVDGRLVEVIQTIEWEKLVCFNECRTQVIPVRLGAISNNIPNLKYLVIKRDDRGGILGAKYYFVLNEDVLLKQLRNVEITPDLLEARLIPENFNGAIIELNLDNTTTSSSHYRAGVLTNKTDKIVIKIKEESGTSQNYVDPEDGCEHTVIEWYWQTWVNGVLVSEEYLYSTTEITCPPGGGGSSGSSSTCSDLTLAQVHTLMGTITTEALSNIGASHGPTQVDEETGRIEKNNNPTWEFYKANFFLGYFARYTAYYTGRVYKNSNNDFWKWNNISFSTISKSSGTLPPCLAQSLTWNVSDPLISTDKKTATTLLNFNVIYTYSCFFGTEAANDNVSNVSCTFGAEN